MKYNSGEEPMVGDVVKCAAYQQDGRFDLPKGEFRVTHFDDKCAVVVPSNGREWYLFFDRLDLIRRAAEAEPATGELPHLPALDGAGVFHAASEPGFPRVFEDRGREPHCRVTFNSADEIARCSCGTAWKFTDVLGSATYWREVTPAPTGELATLREQLAAAEVTISKCMKERNNAIESDRAKRALLDTIMSAFPTYCYRDSVDYAVRCKSEVEWALAARDQNAEIADGLGRQLAAVTRAHTELAAESKRLRDGLEMAIRLITADGDGEITDDPVELLHESIRAAEKSRDGVVEKLAEVTRERDEAIGFCHDLDRRLTLARNALRDAEIPEVDDAINRSMDVAERIGLLVKEAQHHREISEGRKKLALRIARERNQAKAALKPLADDERIMSEGGTSDGDRAIRVMNKLESKLAAANARLQAFGDELNTVRHWLQRQGGHLAWERRIAGLLDERPFKEHELADLKPEPQPEPPTKRYPRRWRCPNAGHEIAEQREDGGPFYVYCHRDKEPVKAGANFHLCDACVEVYDHHESEVKP